VREILRVDDRIIEDVGAVDVQAALTERVLQCRLDRNDLRFVCTITCQRQQDLHVADGRHEELLCGEVVDRLVALDDLAILTRHESRRTTVDGRGNL